MLYYIFSKISIFFFIAAKFGNYGYIHFSMDLTFHGSCSYFKFCIPMIS